VCIGECIGESHQVCIGECIGESHQVCIGVNASGIYIYIYVCMHMSVCGGIRQRERYTRQVPRTLFRQSEFLTDYSFIGLARTLYIHRI